MAQVIEVIIKEVDFEKLLKKKNLNIYKLSKLTGMQETRLANYIKGKTSMTPETWDRIKQYL